MCKQRNSQADEIIEWCLDKACCFCAKPRTSQKETAIGVVSRDTKSKTTDRARERRWQKEMKRKRREKSRNAKNHPHRKFTEMNSLYLFFTISDYIINRFRHIIHILRVESRHGDAACGKKIHMMLGSHHRILFGWMNETKRKRERQKEKKGKGRESRNLSKTERKKGKKRKGGREAKRRKNKHDVWKSASHIAWLNEWNNNHQEERERYRRKRKGNERERQPFPIRKERKRRDFEDAETNPFKSKMREAGKKKKMHMSFTEERKRRMNRRLVAHHLTDRNVHIHRSTTYEHVDVSLSRCAMLTSKHQASLPSTPCRNHDCELPCFILNHHLHQHQHTC